MTSKQLTFKFYASFKTKNKLTKILIFQKYLTKHRLTSTSYIIVITRIKLIHKSY